MSKSENTFQDVLFKPSVLKGLKEGNTKVTNVTLAGASDEMSSAQTSPTGTFRYDPPGSALKSTQQLNVDWSKFENHTFLNSAEMKVQTSFDKIINSFPFDGTNAEYQEFMDQMTGFENYVFSKFPKHLGYMNFKRVDESSNPINNYISVNPIKDATNLGNAIAGSGDYVLTLNSAPFTVEMHLMVPEGANSSNIVLQKVAGEVSGGSTKGVTMAVSSSASSLTAPILTMMSSGSTYISSSVLVEKGKFNHIASVYDRFVTGKIFTYVNGELAGSSNVADFGEMGIEDASLNIGSGSKHSSGNHYEFTPTAQLSGSIDELRVFESVRSQSQLKAFANSSIFAPQDKSLKLYYRFNEPQGSFGISANKDLVLDHSGYGLHARVQMGSGGSFDMVLRSTASMPTPLRAENKDHSPVLFPSYGGVTSLCSEMLTSGSFYDWNNPNLVTKLIPKHYLLEAQQFQGLLDENGDISLTYGYTTDMPGGGKIQSAQIISSMLYLWAETFDEIKMFIDEFGRLLKVDYNSDQTISNHLLPFLAKYYGFNLPNSFSNASMRQFFSGEDLNVNSSKPKLSLQHIQNVMWRRVLTDLPNTFQSRGTRESIEGLFRSMGIRPGGSFRIKEYGGSKTRKITDSYEKRVEVAAMLDFSGTLNPGGVLDGSGKSPLRPLIQSGYLSASRVEPGVPLISGTFVNGISNVATDGLMTSGSWSLEGLFKFESGVKHPITQSLMRLQTTGSSAGAANNWLQFNAVAFSPVASKNTGSLTVYGKPQAGFQSTIPMMKLVLTGVDIFDGNKWHVSFGRQRNDQASSYVSSSYFLRAGKMGPTQIEEFHEQSVYFDDSSDKNALGWLHHVGNASGSFVVIGSQSLDYSYTKNGNYLNTVNEEAARNVEFTGRVSGVRFFSKYLTQKETLQHIRSFKSLGVENPNVNFNFNTTASGSFERMRMNLSCDQPVTMSNALGNLQVFDFSQNMLHASGTGFEHSKQVVKPERFDYMIISPQFELGTDPNKVRVRSYERAENVRSAPSGVSFAPLYSIPENDQPKDDRRLAIEISSVQALNEDIVNIFATLDYLDNAIGDPELVFAEEYRDLRHLRQIYFNRLEDKVSLTKFFQFFKWFDSAVGGLVEELIPSTTRYLGTNFIVESHMLERPKFTYRYSDMYVGITERRESSVIFLQQFLGAIRKF